MQAQATQIIHAYKQAPWRVQRQWVGAFLLVVIGMAMIAALYLDVTAHAAVTGREIQEMRIEITTMQRFEHGARDVRRAFASADSRRTAVAPAAVGVLIRH